MLHQCYYNWAWHDKNNKIACEPSEDSDQPGHPSSLIRVFSVHMKKQWVLSYQATHWVLSEDSDQTRRMSRLIWVFNGRTSNIAGFVLRRLILFQFYIILGHLSCITTKQTKRPARPVKTQISLGVLPVWSEYSLSVWKKQKHLVVCYP